MKLLHLLSQIGLVWLAFSCVFSVAWIVAHWLRPADDRRRDNEEEYRATLQPPSVEPDYPRIQQVSTHGYVLHHGKKETRH